ncbi:MAG TPA: protease inhibitor I42 family protein, partial [Candidatus Limnocylindrales bacterium]|nr:protease inhibitor I42 family protein [Candidatus Limnocylindrales bacterium]
LRVVDRIFRAPGEASPPILGAAGTEILTVHAVASGTTTLSIGYGRSWEVGTPAEWNYTLTVTVS